MTVPYTHEVRASVTRGFARLLFKWRGSVYRLLYWELLIYLILFASVSLLYHLGLDPEQKKTFESIAYYFQKYTDVIPLTFILGFYVSNCTQNYFKQFMTIPWPDRLCYAINGTVLGADEEGRLIRRTLVRYANLMLLLGLHDNCVPLKKKYPKLDDLATAGYITAADRDGFREVVLTTDSFWIPCAWFVDILRRARLNTNRIKDEGNYKLVYQELLDFREKCDQLRKFNWVTLPLVYTQIVTLATYAYFFACLFSRQALPDHKDDNPFRVKFYFPFFTVLEFVIYFGFLKAAEELLNPLGEDDEDFEILYLMERNLRVSYLTVDTCYDQAPDVHKDAFYGKSDIRVDKELQLSGSHEQQNFVSVNTGSINTGFSASETTLTSL